ncbi:hypothetical protein HUU61_01870 [Rhodopseudomonas palustris]|nr:hypothetical protein [Rhodopseudomonas palustris]
MAGTDQRDNGLGQAQTSAEERLAGEFYDLEFSVQKSRRYHEKLCAFYGVWRDWVKIVSVIVGSGVFILVAAEIKHWAELFAALVAMWAILDFMFSPDKRAEAHRALGERFTELAQKIHRSTRNEQTLGELVACRLEIEKAEPPCKRLVDLQARNEECRSRGFPSASMVPLNTWQRVFGYFATFGMGRLERWKDAQHRQV